MKTSALSRSLQLAKMAARIGLKEARSGNLKSRMEQAILLAEGLSNMKGAAMKAGQLLSLELVDYFPKEAVEVLSKLQSSAGSVDFSVVEAVLRKELKEKFKDLEELDPHPIGSASIGQVHRAKYKSRDIVLKIQYPGVSESIDSDLKILRSVAKGFCTLTGRDMDLTHLFEEFKAILTQEVDYAHEAELQKKYFEHALSLTNIPRLTYAVPKIEEELCTHRVLAMEYQPGIPLRQWIQSSPLRLKRELLANGLLNLYFHEFFEWHLVQTDPNQGNFLVRENGENMELVLLDFGATKTYTQEFVENYTHLLKATASGDRKKLKDHAIAFQLIDPRESDEAFEAFYEVLYRAVKPFFSKDGKLLDHSLFDFTDEDHLKKSHQVNQVLASKLKYSPPPHGLVFLHRKLGGVYAILKALRVTIDVAQYWPKSARE